MSLLVLKVAAKLAEEDGRDFCAVTGDVQSQYIRQAKELIAFEREQSKAKETPSDQG